MSTMRQRGCTGWRHNVADWGSGLFATGIVR